MESMCVQNWSSITIGLPSFKIKIENLLLDQWFWCKRKLSWRDICMIKSKLLQNLGNRTLSTFHRHTRTLQTFHYTIKDNKPYLKLNYYITNTLPNPVHYHRKRKLFGCNSCTSAVQTLVIDVSGSEWWKYASRALGIQRSMRHCPLSTALRYYR